MGKPFDRELLSVPGTLQWASEQPIDELVGIVSTLASTSLQVVGSGGSFSAAHHAALLHQAVTPHLARPITPLEIVGLPARASSALFLSAGGSNKDILRAFEESTAGVDGHLAVVCASKGSPLGQLATKQSRGLVYEFSLPTGRDGFLATNSLIATMALLCRAYGAVTGRDWGAQIEQLRISRQPSEKWEEVLSRKNIIVLSSGWGYTAAIDLESKLVEAALASVLLADLRTFAHGRHHWLAKRGAETSVLVLTTPENRRLADSTARQIPAEIPVCFLETKATGPVASIDLTAQILNFVHHAGQRIGVDPGRPGVPEFGRRLYNLGMPGVHIGAGSKHDLWIRRKYDAMGVLPCEALTKSIYQRGLNQFVRALKRTEFRGVVLDYDGTLCNPQERFRELCGDIRGELIRLLGKGLVIGVATGRGGSVTQRLQEALPTELWPLVYVGRYNGAIVRRLDEPTEDTEGKPHPSLVAVAESLASSAQLGMFSTMTIKPHQITLEPNRAGGLTLVSSLARLAIPHVPDVKVIVSDHSLDIIPRSSSKLNVVRTLQGIVGAYPILSIGDSGNEDGNDYELLANGNALSVDKVSVDPNTCWNLAPAGCWHVSATLHYLRKLDVDSGRARFVSAF